MSKELTVKEASRLGNAKRWQGPNAEADRQKMSARMKRANRQFWGQFTPEQRAEIARQWWLVAEERKRVDPEGMERKRRLARARRARKRALKESKK